jgi:hypothetical protein
VHFPRRMALGEIQLCEVVVVGLDIGTLGDGKAQVGENGRQFVHHLAERMNAALFGGRLPQRQRDVDGLGCQPCIESGRFQDVAARGEREADLVLGEIDRSTLRLAFVRRSSGDILPSVASSAEIEPFLPSAETRTASSTASSLAAAMSERIWDSS